MPSFRYASNKCKWCQRIRGHATAPVIWTHSFLAFPSQEHYRLVVDGANALPEDRGTYKHEYERCVLTDEHGNDKEDPRVRYRERCKVCGGLTSPFEWQDDADFISKRKDHRHWHRNTQTHRKAVQPEQGPPATGPERPEGAVGEPEPNGTEVKALGMTWETVVFYDAQGQLVSDGYKRERNKGGHSAIVVFPEVGTTPQRRQQLREYAAGIRKPRSTTSRPKLAQNEARLPHTILTTAPTPTATGTIANDDSVLSILSGLAAERRALEETTAKKQKLRDELHELDAKKKELEQQLHELEEAGRAD